MRQPTGIDRTIALGMLGAGALVGLATPAASAATANPATPRTPAAMYQWELARIGQIKLYPLAGTAVDPLSNTMGTDLGGLPVSTAPISALFADGLPMRDLPLLGSVLAPPAPASKPADDPNDANPHNATGEAQPAAPAAVAPAAAAAAPAVGVAAAPAAAAPAAAAAAPAAPVGAAAPAVPATAQGPLFGPLQ